MILPGEIAPAHRHVSSAIRFVLDGEGAYTAVEGEKAFMSPGDFVITANWAPHDHGNPSQEADALARRARLPGGQFLRDLVRRVFRRRRRRTPTAADGDSLAFYGSGVLPDGTPARLNRSPVINYTYARTRPIVERLNKAGDIDKRHGARVRYANPINGGPVLPTMGANLALLPKGFKGEHYRATDGTIFVCTEGHGTHHGRRQGAGMGPERRVRGAAVEALCPRRPTRSRCCSRSPTAPRRRRSASGARTPARIEIEDLSVVMVGLVPAIHVLGAAERIVVTSEVRKARRIDPAIPGSSNG